MENSELGNQEPCLNPPFNFPPHRRRRRPLQSETFRTFVRIISHCNALQSLPQHQKQGESGEQTALVNHNGMESENSFVQQKSPIGGIKDVDGFKDGGNGTLNKLDWLDPMDIIKQGNEELMQDKNGGSIIEKITDRNGICNVVDINKEFSPTREQKLFDEPSVNEVPETIDSSVDMAVTADMSRPVGSSNAKSCTMEGNSSEGIEHELQLKQEELEKLISASGNLDLINTADDEIEEGEISGEIGVNDEVMDLLFEDSVSLKEKNLDKVQVSEHADIEVFTFDGGDGQMGKYDVRSSLSFNTVDSGNDRMELGKKCPRKEQDASAEDLAHGEDIATISANERDTFPETAWTGKKVGGIKEADHPAVSMEDLSQGGEIIHTDKTENKGSVAAGMEASVGKKKKKGPLTKERRAKKKQKERIKRAEKNRKLGVKRLKLQPILKPKTVTYCRHYLKGRCQEGEKCKFSHDTTPLTKSTPCCYFARHSCMKGDNCPFDHQLSKYLCNSIASKGFCSKGADCLFSHEISAKDGSWPTSNVSKPELKSQFLTSVPNSKKVVNNQGISPQHVDAKFSTIENSSGKNTEKKVSEHLDRPAAHVPKGICFFSHVRSPADGTSKHDQSAPRLKEDDTVQVGHCMSGTLSDTIQKSNDIPKAVPLRTPKGINFLSFGKHPLDDSVTREYAASESLLDQQRKSQLVGLPLKSDGGAKIDNQTGQRSSVLEADGNKMENIVSPVSTPQGMNFLSFGKVPLDNLSAGCQTGVVPHNVNSGLAWVQQKINALQGLKSSNEIPHRLASSSPPFFQFSDQSGAGNSGGNSSSMKTALLLNTPTSVQNALQSTLAFAAKFESEIKLDQSLVTKQ